MDALNPLWTIRDILDRGPTRLEEALALYLIRSGRRYDLELILISRTDPAPCIIGTVGDAIDVLDELEDKHKPYVRDQLRNAFWRIRGSRITDSWRDAYRALSRTEHPDTDLIVYALRHAGQVWPTMTPEERAAVRKAARDLQDSAIWVREKERAAATPAPPESDPGSARPGAPSPAQARSAGRAAPRQPRRSM